MRAGLSGTAFLGAAIVGCSGWLVYYSGGAIARAADAIMRDEVARGDFSGTVLVSRDGKLIFEKSYGLADTERLIPNTAATKFQIGSITKSFTAVLVLQLEHERRLALSDPICDFLEECPAGWGPIQLHHLLAHTSGIYNFTNDRPPEALLPTPQTHQQILARFLHAPLEFRAGEKFSYSNSNFYLLGLVIEKAGGETYEAALKRRILEPLDMRDTGIFHRGVALVNGARGYHRDARGRFINAQDLHESWMYAAGAIYSTVDDLAKFSDALASERLLSKAALERMWQPEKGSYGLGWQTPFVSARTFNRRAVEHGGRVPGFSAYLRRFVDDGLTIVVLSNRFDTQPERVASSLSAAAFGESYRSVFDRKPIDLTPQARRRYLGDYELDGVRFTLFERDGALYARSDDWPEVGVFAENDDELYLPGTEGSVFAVENNEGQLTGLMISMGGTPKIARKVR